VDNQWITAATRRLARERLLGVVAALCAFSGPAVGADLVGGALNINGSGGAAYAVTRHNDVDNSPVHAGPDGSFENLELNLAITAKIAPQVTLAGQLFFDDIGGLSETGLDWTFVQIDFSRYFKLRAGKIKLPLGISSEVESIGTLRPFYSLPDTVYGPTSIASEGYFGAGITGQLYDRAGWSLAYDAFGGELEVQMLEPFQRLGGTLVPGTVTAPENTTVKGLIGGRLVLGTPIEGLSLLASGYRGSLEDFGTLTLAMLSIDYEGDRWLFRAEGFRSAEREITHGGYLEAAYYLTQHVQVAAQMQGLRTHSPGVPDDSTFLSHVSVALGLNYWFSPSMVVKASIYGIRGNRLAFPRLLDDALLAGSVSRDTPYFTLGTQFSF
jgi:hypothetical protein